MVKYLILIALAIVAGLGITISLYAVSLYFVWDIYILRIGLLLLGLWAAAELALRFWCVPPHLVEFSNMTQRADPASSAYQIVQVYCRAESPMFAIDKAKLLAGPTARELGLVFDSKCSVKETFWLTYVFKKTIKLIQAT